MSEDLDRLKTDKKRIKCKQLDYERLYNELIMAVAKKYPGESRHQTALRYIQNAERSSGQSNTSKVEADGEGGAI